MLRIYLILVICLLCTSCATILNTKVQTVSIQPDTKIEIIHVKQDTTIIHKNYDYYVFLRSKKPIYIQFKNLLDSGIHDVTIKPFLSNSLWYNMIGSVYGLPGLILDAFSSKKWAFPQKSYITNDNRNVMEKKANMKLFIPCEYGVFMDKSKNVEYSYLTVPPLNPSLGLEYYHRHNQYVSGELGVTVATIGLGRSNSGQNEHPINLSMRNNHILNNFELGYGLSGLTTRRMNSVGLSFSGVNMMTRVIGFRMVYEPYFFNVNEFKYNFSYYFRMGLIFKINLRK